MQSHLGTKQIDPHSKLNADCCSDARADIGRKEGLGVFLVQTFNGIFPGRATNILIVIWTTFLLLRAWCGCQKKENVFNDFMVFIFFWLGADSMLHPGILLQLCYRVKFQKKLCWIVILSKVKQVKLRETTLDLDLTQNYVKVAQRLRYIFERCTLQGGREHKKLRHNIWDD